MYLPGWMLRNHLRKLQKYVIQIINILCQRYFIQSFLHCFDIFRLLWLKSVFEWRNMPWRTKSVYMYRGIRRSHMQDKKGRWETTIDISEENMPYFYRVFVYISISYSKFSIKIRMGIRISADAMLQRPWSCGRLYGEMQNNAIQITARLHWLWNA